MVYRIRVKKGELGFRDMALCLSHPPREEERETKVPLEMIKCAASELREPSNRLFYFRVEERKRVREKSLIVKVFA